MKVVLANSPGIDEEGNYIIYSPSRWCEGIRNRSRWFAYYPWELGYLSSLLKCETNHKVKLIDGCLEKLDKFQYFNRIVAEQPDYLLFESSTRTVEESLWVAKKIKDKLGTKLIFVGQHPAIYPKMLLQEGVDYIGIGEYEESILEIFKGKDFAKIKGIYPNKKRELLDVNNLPFPEDKDVKRIDYSYPGEPCAEYREVEMFASRGCPFNCNFCVARNVYYKKPNWRPRDIKNIIDEIRYLKNKYSDMEGIFFNEEVHNGSKKFILSLCKEIINNKLDYLNYEAMCDVRLLDEETIYAMKQAGYYKIRVGIESASNKVLKAINKNIDLYELEEKLNICKKNDIKTYGTFMFGSSKSNLKEDNKTIGYIKKLIRYDLLDDVQISICTPQPGTPFYSFIQGKEYLNTKKFLKFDGGLNSVVDYPEYSSSQILRMKNLALKKRDIALWIRRFKKLKLWKWLKLRYKKYGFKKLFFKIIGRIDFILRLFIEKNEYN